MTTIVAQVTASGCSSVGIIRLSGDKTLAIAKKILSFTPKARYAHYGNFFDCQGQMLDKGIAIFYPSPHSYTGEDVLEMQAHGSRIILSQLIDTTLSLGAVLAQAGEFSQRAVINNKMDLAQAEAVADLIASSSRHSAQSALRSLEGIFSQKINALVDALTKLRVIVESNIDFSDEKVDIADMNYIQKELISINERVDNILSNANEGAILREGIDLVISGKPNAGKSSLLNMLTQRDSAIVTNIAGTTRDILSQSIQIKGIPLNISDTAGIHHSQDEIEKEGIARAYQAINNSDAVILIYDANDDTADLNILSTEARDKPILIIRNKIDLLNEVVMVKQVDCHTQISLSTKTGAGKEQLYDALLALAGLQDLGEHTILARKRHLIALREAKSYLSSAQHQLNQNSLELLAEDLRLSANALSCITGMINSDDLLGEIFSQFCIGK